MGLSLCGHSSGDGGLGGHLWQARGAAPHLGATGGLLKGGIFPLLQPLLPLSLAETSREECRGPEAADLAPRNASRPPAAVSGQSERARDWDELDRDRSLLSTGFGAHPDSFDPLGSLCLRPSHTRSLMGREQDRVWGGQDQFLLSRRTKNLGL